MPHIATDIQGSPVSATRHAKIKITKIITFSDAATLTLYSHLDHENLLHSGHYHYQCVCQIWEQSIQCLLSYHTSTIYTVGGPKAIWMESSKNLPKFQTSAFQQEQCSMPNSWNYPWQPRSVFVQGVETVKQSRPWSSLGIITPKQ